MIELHRLAHHPEPFLLNPDLILTVEERPDTHVVLTTGVNHLVTETPAEVQAAVRDFRVDVLARALDVVRARA